MDEIMPTLHFKKNIIVHSPTSENNEQKDDEMEGEKLDDQTRKKLTFRPRRRLKLQLTRKSKNSPFLSIQKFLKEEINEHQDLSIARDLWEKYSKQSKNALLIERHNIDLHLFLELYSQIMNTQEHLESPAYSMPRKFIKPSSEEMEYLNL